MQRGALTTRWSCTCLGGPSAYLGLHNSLPGNRQGGGRGGGASGADAVGAPSLQQSLHILQLRPYREATGLAVPGR